jgi:hypothetical protein
MVLSLRTLSVEIIYQILGNLENKELFLSMRNVCHRLNTIIDSYRRYQVKLYFLFLLIYQSFHCFVNRKSHYLYSLTLMIQLVFLHLDNL